MHVSQARLGMQVGTGVTIDGIRRDGRDHSVITLSTGRSVRMHKRASLADLFVGHVPARSLERSDIREAHRIRASDPEWRGERAGRKGERTTANFPVDYRAVMERRQKVAGEDAQ